PVGARLLPRAAFQGLTPLAIIYRPLWGLRWIPFNRRCYAHRARIPPASSLPPIPLPGVPMTDWAIGVFDSIDAGMGVKLDVARELGVPTIQLHAPHKETRTQANADAFLKKLADYGIRLTAVFGGFEGESYADIPT